MGVSETIPGRVEAVCRRLPGAVAVIDGDRRIAYGELSRRVDRFANRLAGDGLVGVGDRAVISLANSLEFVTAFLALARLGVTAVPIRTDLRDREIEGYVKTVAPRCAIISRRSEASWRGIAADSKAMGLLLAEDLVTDRERPDARACPVPTVPSSADAVYLSTSGTTGRPKLVPRSHPRLLAGAGNVARALGITASDRFLAVVPFHHANGFSNCMLLPLLHGCAITVLPRFRPRELARVVNDERITVLIGSPLVFSMIAEQGAGRDAFATVRIALSSGAAMPPGLAARCATDLGIRVRELYGSTETGTIAIEPADADFSVGAAGVPVPGVTVRIVDDRGHDVPPGGVGEVLVRSPAMMPGYVNPSEADAALFHDGYLRTGDMGRLEGNGRLRLEGRKKTVLNVAGIQIDPVEIANVLESMPGVRAARVGAAIDARGFEIIEAEVQTHPGVAVGRKDIVAFCRGRLAEHKIPRVLRIVDCMRGGELGKDQRMFGR